MWPHGFGHPRALHSPDPSASTSGYNCSLFKTPLLPNQEILNERCPSLPVSTLSEKEGGATGKQAKGVSGSPCGPHQPQEYRPHTHTHRHRYAHRCIHTDTPHTLIVTHIHTLRPSYAYTHAHRHLSTHPLSRCTRRHTHIYS